MLSASNAPGMHDDCARPLCAVERLRAAACYLGLGPLVKSRGSVSGEAFFGQHFAQAMVALFLFATWVVVAVSIDISKFLILIWFPDLDSKLDQLEFCVTYVLLLALGVFMVLWSALLALALAGSSRKLPVIRRLTGLHWMFRFSSMANRILLALIPMVGVLTWHAASLTRRCGDSGAVYFLYDDGIPVPRWSYALGLYRISLQARRNWGGGSVVLDRLDPENLRSAMAHGKVVILATHGEKGFAYAINKVVPRIGAGTLCVAPPDPGATDQMNRSQFLRLAVLGADNNWSNAGNVTVGDQLRIAYVFACDAGIKASQWKEHLSPAQVIMYNRTSTLYDHAWWFAFTGPALLRKF